MSQPSSETRWQLPEITPRQLAEWLADRPDLVLLDVREPMELRYAHLADARVVYAPLSDLAQHQLEALPPQAQDPSASIVVLCHHGSRSAQVTAWLQHLGWQSVYNLAGGIDAYARQIDASVGMY